MHPTFTCAEVILDCDTISSLVACPPLARPTHVLFKLFISCSFWNYPILLFYEILVNIHVSSVEYMNSSFHRFLCPSLFIHSELSYEWRLLHLPSDVNRSRRFWGGWGTPAWTSFARRPSNCSGLLEESLWSSGLSLVHFSGPETSQGKRSLCGLCDIF